MQHKRHAAGACVVQASMCSELCVTKSLILRFTLRAVSAAGAQPDRADLANGSKEQAAELPEPAANSHKNSVAADDDEAAEEGVPLLANSSSKAGRPATSAGAPQRNCVWPPCWYCSGC